jgi:ubiquinone/menaquinone biosynthesis C-methylase UbiE
MSAMTYMVACGMAKDSRLNDIALSTDSHVLDWLRDEYARPFSGWDLSYLDGRVVHPAGQATWNLAGAVAEVWARSDSILDVDTGGGERLEEWIGALGARRRVIATEAWPPNVPMARQRLASLGVSVVQTPASALPFRDDAFDLVTNRHGWLVTDEIHRVLRPEG